MPQHLRIKTLIFLLLVTLLADRAYCQPHAKNHSYSVATAPLENQEKNEYHLKVIQPYAFNLKTLQKFMLSLAYQERNVSWSAKKRVFSSHDIQVLAPRIKEQFALSSKKHRVTYQIKNSKGKTLLKGDTFLTSQGMNWRITTINRSKREIGDFSLMGDSWRLVPLTGQKYKTHERQKNLIQDISNWVLFINFHPNPKHILKKPALPQHEGSPTNAKNRLKVLDELKSEGLINEKEYEKKRQEILNSL